MAKLHERRGNVTLALEHYQKFFEAYPKKSAAYIVEAAYMVAQIHARKGRKAEAEKWYNKVIYNQKALSTSEAPVGASYAAEAKYIKVSVTYDELRAIKIPNNPAS